MLATLALQTLAVANAPLLGRESSLLSTSLAKASALRGGASLGPIDPSFVVNMHVVVGALYAVEMVVPAITNPSQKYVP